jgi:tetratricopeptide (TPR) repeat protein
VARTLIFLLFLAAPAHADAVSDDLARAHYKAAQSYFKQGRAEDALREFQEAYRISPRPAFHYNIAICYEKLGKLEEAIAAYERYLAEVPEAGDRFTVREKVAELKKRAPTPPEERAAPPPEAPPPPEAAAEPPPPSADEPELTVRPRRALSKPVWQRGWFWGVVGGGVALVTTVIVVGVVVGTAGPDSPYTLPQVTLR